MSQYDEEIRSRKRSEWCAANVAAVVVASIGSYTIEGAWQRVEALYDAGVALGHFGPVSPKVSTVPPADHSFPATVQDVQVLSQERDLFKRWHGEQGRELLKLRDVLTACRQEAERGREAHVPSERRHFDRIIVACKAVGA